MTLSQISISRLTSILFVLAIFIADAAVAQIITGDSLGIGRLPRAGIKVDVIGSVLISPGNGGAMQFGTPNAETGMSNIVGPGRADLRFDGQTLKLVAGLVGGPPPSANGITINTNGNVGIGTAPSANAKLRVNGFVTNGIYATSNFGYGVVGEGAFGGVRGFSNGSGARGVYGMSINSAGVEGSSNGGNNFAVFSNGFLGVDRLGTGGNTTMCRNFLNQIATCSSSLRYKTDLQPFDDGLDFINQLYPIAFKWKGDSTLDIGFGAEDVAKINQLFVTYNDNGEVEGVKYDRLSVVFVNAFKEQKAQIEQQQRQLEQQRLQIETLKALMCVRYPEAAICASSGELVGPWGVTNRRDSKN